MFKALVYSIPGTGTRFVTRVLEQCFGYALFGTDQQEFVRLETHQYYIQRHVDQYRRTHAEIGLLLTDPHCQMIVPLRHPYHSYLTRRHRLELDKGGTKEKSMEILWKKLIEAGKYTSAVYIPMEAELDRSKLLQQIETRLEAVPDVPALEAFIAEWPKVGSESLRPERREFDKTGEIDGERPEFLDFAVSWYEGVVSSLKAIN